MWIFELFLGFFLVLVVIILIGVALAAAIAFFPEFLGSVTEMKEAWARFKAKK